MLCILIERALPGCGGTFPTRSSQGPILSAPPVQAMRSLASSAKYHQLIWRRPEFLNTEGQVAISMMPSIPLPGEQANVINASDRFAQKRFKDEFTWTPSFELEQAIIKKSFE